MKNYDGPIQRSRVVEIDEGLRSYMVQVYSYMALGLGLTGIVSFIVSQSPDLMHQLFATPLKWLVLLAPIGVVFFLGARMHSLSLSAAQTTFWIYSALMGISMASIFYIFTGESIARLFFIAASIFGAMSLYGYTTKKDLTQIGSFLMMGCLGIFIAGLVNIFFQSSALQMVISVIGVIVFTGLTAYDTQAIKESYLENESYELAGKKAIFGALQLYLDFINLFISLLHIFGERR